MRLRACVGQLRSERLLYAGLGHAEVEQMDVPLLVHEEVGGFYVAMKTLLAQLSKSAQRTIRRTRALWDSSCSSA